MSKDIVQRLQALVDDGLTVKVHRRTTPFRGPDGVWYINPRKLSECIIHLYSDSTEEHILTLIEEYEQVRIDRIRYENNTIPQVLEDIIQGLKLEFED